jgi:hypothetical protein
MVSGWCGAYALSTLDSLPFFYERSIYLEDLALPGAMWANPARIAPIDRTTLYTATVGMLGSAYSMSTVRVIVPADTGVNLGFGVSGTGITTGSSGNGTNGGAQITSYFNFTRPSFEGALSYDRLPIGTLGGELLGGTESIPSVDSASSAYFFWGYSIGWISPVLLKSVQLSLSTLGVHHAYTWFANLWDNDAKIGLLFNVHDSLVLGSLEYGCSLHGPFSFLTTGNSSDTSYDVLKGEVSIRVKSIVGILLGFSTDTRIASDNGATYHAGVELRRSRVYPFYGGYEFGVSPWAYYHFSVLNRIWVGYGFGK